VLEALALIIRQLYALRWHPHLKDSPSATDIMPLLRDMAEFNGDGEVKPL